MKKRRQRLSHTTGPLKLYRDDIQKILDALGEIPEELEPEITVSTGEFDLTPDEIGELQQPSLDALDITVKTKVAWVFWLRVQVFTDSCLVDTYGDDPVSRGVFARVKDIVGARIRRSRWTNELDAIAAILGSIASTMIVLGFATDEPTSQYIGYGLMVLGILLFLLSLLTKPLRRSIVILETRESRPSFWKRNKDQIWLIVITAIISITLTILAALIFGIGR